MTRQKPKISFDTAPGDPVQSGAIPAQTRRVQIVRPEQNTAGPGENLYKDEPLFDREAWERDLALPKPAEPVEAIASMKALPRSSAQASPRAPGFAATGLMAVKEPGFLQRHSRVLLGAGAVAATFVLGVVTAVLILQGDEPMSGQSAGAFQYVPETFSEAPTRAVTADMTDVSEVSSPASQTGETGGALTTAVLAGLQVPTAAIPKPARSQPERVRDALEALSIVKLRMIRESVIAGLFDVEIYDSDGVARVRLRTYNAPLANMASSNLMLDMIGMGEAEMSAALRTPEGEVDVETMMFELVQASLLADEDVARTEAALDMSRKMFAASKARTEAIDGRRIYTVQKGDSLAYIALQFYGRPSEYARILEANRDTIQSSGEIQIGQRLTIPS